MTYRKKPEEVQAIQFTGDNIQDIAAFCNSELYFSYKDGHIMIELEKGEIWLVPTDYAVKDEFGVISRVKEASFHRYYELSNN